MSSQLKISNATERIETGDIMKYFEMQDEVFQENDGIHDFKTFTENCVSSAVPFELAESTTTFKITNSGVDIMNIDKTTITMKANCTFRYDLVSGTAYTADVNTTQNIKNYYIFVGLKSASHLINSYHIDVAGKPIEGTNQLYGLDEQTVVRLSKTEQELTSRPNMYSDYQNVYHANGIVCGKYIKLSDLINGPVTKEIEFCFQLDDLLPFSAMSLYPRFLYGDMILNIKTTIQKNFVWAMVNLEDAFKYLEPQETDGNSSKWPLEVERQFQQFKVNKCFNQCGDTAQIIVPNYDVGSTSVVASSQIARISITGATVTKAYSNSCGFNIKNNVKQMLVEKYSKIPMKIPAQWCSHKRSGQSVSNEGVASSDSFSLSNATQIAIIFPRTVNQKTVSKNPLQNAFSVKVDSKVYPVGDLSTLDSRHCELMLSNLCLDSLFSASKSLVNALTFKEYNETASRVCVVPDDNSDYMFTVCLERPGNGVFFDGANVPSCPIDITGKHISGTNNPAYFTGGNLNSTNLNPELNIISDAAWLFSPDGIINFIH